MFFKYPHTPHLIWLAKTPCREDKVLSPIEAREFLDAEIIIEEKVDGGNIGFSLDERGTLQVQNRGNYLTRGSHLQFQPLWSWIDAHRFALIDALGPNLMLFGEWCYAIHSVPYNRLPDWFLGFDVYDRTEGRFWSVERRNPWLNKLDLTAVPEIARGQFSMERLPILMQTSRFSNGPLEGLYLRRDRGDWLKQRAKIVRPEFIEAITGHWSEGPLVKNSLAKP